MNDTLSIRRATPEDADSIRELLRLCLGEGSVPRTQDYWRWKHEANPFGESPVLVAEDGYRLVGLRTFMRWTWAIGSREVSAVRAVDTATHPDYQGQGIFSRLTLQFRNEMEAEGIGMVFNTPNGKSLPGYLKMGWQTIGRPSIWIKPVRPVHLAESLRGEKTSGAEGEPPPIRTETAAKALERHDVLDIVDALRKPTEERYHTEVTRQYLLWRYGAAPNADYRIATEGRGGDGALIAIRTRRRGDFREMRICEAAAGPTPEARRNLMRLMRGAARLSDVDAVVVLPTPYIERLSLVRAGFLPVLRSGPILTSFPLCMSETDADPLLLKNWSLSIGSLELF